MKVLISPGYGAGWSTWNDPRMAFDERLIRAFESGISKEEMTYLCIEQGYGYTGKDGLYVYMDGFDTLKVVEVPSGTWFKIAEYDGSEYIITFDETDWYYSEGEYYDCNS